MLSIYISFKFVAGTFAQFLGVQTYGLRGGRYPGVERKETAALTSPPTLRAALQLPGALEAPPPAVPGSRRAGGLFLTTPLPRGWARGSKALKLPHPFTSSLSVPKLRPLNAPRGRRPPRSFPDSAQAAQVPSAPRQVPVGPAVPGAGNGRRERAEARRASPSAARAAAPGSRTRRRRAPEASAAGPLPRLLSFRVRTPEMSEAACMYVFKGCQVQAVH